MKPDCTLCRWLQQYRCPQIKTHCRFNCPEFAQNGEGCIKFKERDDG